MLQTPQIVVSIAKPAQGCEVVHDFALSRSFVCIGCGLFRADTLSPVELIHDDDGTVSTTGAALCKACSRMLPVLPAWCRETWPAITARDVESLWDLVRAEHVAQALDLSRADASAPAAKGFKALAAAGEQTRRDQDADNAMEVR